MPREQNYRQRLGELMRSPAPPYRGERVLETLTTWVLPSAEEGSAS